MAADRRQPHPETTDPEKTHAERRGADKRARILDAAYRVCERRGVEGAHMEEVAQLAHVSKGTLYRYFESKEHLLLATIIDSYEANLPRAEPAGLPGAPPAERLARILEGLVEVLEAVAPRMRVYYQAWGLVAKDPALEARLYAALSEFHEARTRTLAETLRAGQAAGAFRAELDIEAACASVQAMLSGFLYRATFQPERAGADLLHRCLAGVLEHVQPPAEAGPARVRMNPAPTERGPDG